MKKSKPQLGLFIANLVATVIFGGVWYTVNVLLGNAIALIFLGWSVWLPAALLQMVAALPSGGQLLFEETTEARKRARERGEKEEGLDNVTLGFIATLSTTLDIVGPALGIMVTAKTLGGEMAVVPAVILAFIASWVCQRIAWRCLKKTISMTWDALGYVLAAPFQTKTNRANGKRKGHSMAFQHQLETPREE